MVWWGLCLGMCGAPLPGCVLEHNSGVLSHQVCVGAHTSLCVQNRHYLCGCVELVLEVLNWCVWVVLTPFCLIQSVGM